MNIHSSSNCNSSQAGTTQMPITQCIYKTERYSVMRPDNLQIHDSVRTYYKYGVVLITYYICLL